LLVKLRKYERDIIVATRFMAGAAVLGSIAGSLLMFILGLSNIFQAYGAWLPSSAVTEKPIPPSAAAIISVIEGLDRFLIAIVLLYFGYGVYSLFIHPERAEEELALPAWLRVKQIGQLKQVVAEVIIVILFVLFLRAALQIFQSPDRDMSWLDLGVFLSLPLATALLALALRLLELHPKPARPLSQTAEEVERDPAAIASSDASPRRGERNR
jgi:uncharacterized membrane protein YqhA